ncbi:hypothetical protein HDU97_003547 [Phlyctochytrium planicorne]|nr:hypothetical protein HDU97_003547 [Phlyctochytrium planicorne]
MVSAHDDDNDVEVRREDQENINSFAKMNARLTDLEDALEAKKKEMEYLDDLEGELQLLDEDDPVKYRIGDTFIDIPYSESQERLEKDKESLGEDIKEIESRMATLKKGMDGLKKVLYARFGKSINLEK